MLFGVSFLANRAIKICFCSTTHKVPFKNINFTIISGSSDCTFFGFFINHCAPPCDAVSICDLWNGENPPRRRDDSKSGATHGFPRYNDLKMKSRIFFSALPSFSSAGSPLGPWKIGYSYKFPRWFATLGYIMANESFGMTCLSAPFMHKSRPAGGGDDDAACQPQPPPRPSCRRRRLVQMTSK